MDGVVGPIKAYLKKRDPATIDNFAFKLHYRVTFVVMLVCMMLVTARYIYISTHIYKTSTQYLHISTTISTQYLRRQFIGDPISCIADGVPGGTLDLYCWIHSTFSVPGRSDPAIVYKYLCAYLQIFLCIFTNIFVRLRISV